MRRLGYVILIFSLVSCNRKLPADMIIFGGNIYTLSDKSPVVEAVVVSADTIRYSGSLINANNFRGEKTKMIDLAGQTMTPGFIEGHGHIMGLGYNEMNINLMGLKNFDEIIALVEKAAVKAKPGEWIVGRGWHQDKWDKKPDRMVQGLPTHDAISKAAPENPVLLEHASGHNILVNQKAMQLAGISATSREKIKIPVGGEIIRDQLGNPTGLFNETAADLITQIIPQPSIETDKKALELAVEACLSNGITSFHSAGENKKTIELMQSFASDQKLKVRMYVMLSGTDQNLLQEYFLKGPQIDKWLSIRSIKLYSDGALGSRGAWLLEPYQDQNRNFGQPNMIMDSVTSISRRALQTGFQVCTHAIGDRANREVLNRYEQAFRENPSAASNARFRIEHAQHLHPDDIPRFAQLGVIPAMQAIHLSSDRPWAIDRLGEKRIIDGAYVWKKLLDTGAIIVNGSDVPVEPINPLASFYASVTRKTLKGLPQEGYEPQQVMTREQALKSYTIDAAFGAFEEKVKGSIQTGKLADFTVFSKNIMTISPDEILTTEVTMTIVGGQILYLKK